MATISYHSLYLHHCVIWVYSIFHQELVSISLLVGSDWPGPGDLLWLIECGRSSGVPVLSLSFKGPGKFMLPVWNPGHAMPTTHASLLGNERPFWGQLRFLRQLPANPITESPNWPISHHRHMREWDTWGTRRII